MSLLLKIFIFTGGSGSLCQSFDSFQQTNRRSSTTKSVQQSDNHHDDVGNTEKRLTEKDKQFEKILMMLIEIKEVVRKVESRLVVVECVVDRLEAGLGDQQSVLVKKIADLTQMENIDVICEKSSIPSLPFNSIDDLEEFEQQLSRSKKTRKTFVCISNKIVL